MQKKIIYCILASNLFLSKFPLEIYDFYPSRDGLYPTHRFIYHMTAYSLTHEFIYNVTTYSLTHEFIYNAMAYSLTHGFIYHVTTYSLTYEILQ